MKIWMYLITQVLVINFGCPWRWINLASRCKFTHLWSLQIGMITNFEWCRTDSHMINCWITIWQTLIAMIIRNLFGVINKLHCFPRITHFGFFIGNYKNKRWKDTLFKNHIFMYLDSTKEYILIPFFLWHIEWCTQ